LLYFLMLQNMQENFPRVINEEFHATEVTPQQMDFLLGESWRNFGTYFFRHNLGFYFGEIRKVIPLRIRVADFTFSKSQRRIFNKNEDLKIIIRPIIIDEEKHSLFHRHKLRFEENVPPSIFTFLSAIPATVPCEALEICVYEDEKLLAVSFFNLGEDSTSGIYAMFEPIETSRSLGIYTMLLEIEYAKLHGKNYYYQGYAYEGNSFYDYKKRFRSLEMYNWFGNWINFSE
jgi:leucyl-tRNA---protein transferase